MHFCHIEALVHISVTHVVTATGPWSSLNNLEIALNWDSL